MTATIKAIETSYRGYRFRSRLEARWAVFFDVLDTHWEYEPEGFVLSDGSCYLPDFWLPNVRRGSWAEVKPFEHGDFKKTEWYGKVAQFVMEKHTKLWLCIGTPTDRVTMIHPGNPNCLIVDNHLSAVFPKKLLIEASNQARAARFEHGEQPVIKRPKGGPFDFLWNNPNG